MDGFVRVVSAISRLCGIIAVVALMAAVVVVVQMVVMRYFLGQSTVWQTEFVTFAIVASTFIGAPYVLLHKGHVNVDLVPFYLSHRWRLVLALIASVLALVFCLVLTWYSAEYFHEAWVEDWTTETIWALPLWIPLSSLPVGMGLLSLQYIADILCLLTGRDAPFGMQAEEGE